MTNNAPNNSETVTEVLVATVSDRKTLHAYSLVLCAKDIEHKIQSVNPHDIKILVSPDKAEEATKELAAYLEENENWPEKPETKVLKGPVFHAMAPTIIGILAGIYSLSGSWRPEALWFAKGAGDATAILQNHELYRLVTALTLHADLSHLLSNCFLGLFLLHYYFQLTGNGIGLLALLLSSVAANFLNVLIHGSDHHFVGFSTTIFCNIGLLCSLSYFLKSKRILVHFFMPLMAGLALLAFLGTEGEKTDLGAHLFGLLSGLGLGTVVRGSWFHALRSSALVQFTLAIAVFSTVGACWFFAFME